MLARYANSQETVDCLIDKRPCSPFRSAGIEIVCTMQYRTVLATAFRCENKDSTVRNVRPELWRVESSIASRHTQPPVTLRSTGVAWCGVAIKTSNVHHSSNVNHTINRFENRLSATGVMSDSHSWLAGPGRRAASPVSATSTARFRFASLRRPCHRRVRSMTSRIPEGKPRRPARRSIYRGSDRPWTSCRFGSPDQILGAKPCHPIAPLIAYDRRSTRMRGTGHKRWHYRHCALRRWGKY